MSRSPFRRIAIVGVGLIGGSIGLQARRRLRAARIVGVDRRPVLRRALARRALHEGTTSLARGLAGADLVILALPVATILKLMPRIATLAPRTALVTDVGGTKAAIVRAAARAGLGRRFVGGHPMTGSERSGVEHADGRLIDAAVWILCPAWRRGPEEAAVRDLVTRLGGRPVALSARRHDEVMARLSHLPQLLSVALVNVAARGPAGRSPGLAGPAFRQMSRLAVSSPRLWAGILSANRANLARVLGELGREIALLRRGLRGGAAERFRRAARLRRRFARARGWRAASAL